MIPTVGSDWRRSISLSPMRSEYTIPPGKPFVPTLSLGWDQRLSWPFDANESRLPYRDMPLPFSLALRPIACMPPPKTFSMSFNGDLPLRLLSPDGESE